MHAPPLTLPVYRRSTPGRRRGLAASVAATLIASLLLLIPSTSAQAAPTLLSQGKPVTASSQENGGTPASGANDGNTGTRWSSAASDPQWIQIDLGSSVAVSQIVLNWETAYAKAYKIEFSANGVDGWTQAYATTTSPGGTETLNVSGTARFVRLTGTQRATAWGYSLWEFQVFGGTSGGTGDPIPGGGDLGPNVLVFDPSTPNIQGRLDQIFDQQESDQFGTGRYQLLFKPGTYNNINAQLGFYTSISGLGLSPDDTTFNGDVTVDAELVQRKRHPELLALRREPRAQPGQRHQPLGGRAGRAVPPYARQGRTQPRPQRLRLGQWRLHRRQQDRRHRRPVLPAAVVHP